MASGDAILGEIQKVEPRQLWPNEAADFTPWLAREENLARLGAAIGLELEFENKEVAVGPYFADILARDTANGEYVVIENQLGKTDHDHLGKALTYAAVLDASAVVWIALLFADEHTKALDWLNDHTSDEVSFFGVRLELWSIDDSRPAIRFNLTSRPTEIVRDAAALKAQGQLTPAKRLQLEWWTEFREALKEAGVVPSLQSPRPQGWYNVALGRSGIHLSVIAAAYEGRIGVRVYLRHKAGGDVALEQLLEQRSAIEEEIGAELQWNPRPENQDKVISVERPANLEDRGTWEEHMAWLVDMTHRFRGAFGPRVRKLDLEPVDSPDEDALPPRTLT